MVIAITKRLLFFHDCISNDHTNATLQFTSNGQAGEITFEVRFFFLILLKSNKRKGKY